MDSDRLLTLIRTVCSGIPAVEGVAPGPPLEGEASEIVITVADFIPGEEGDPWEVRTAFTPNFVHPLFDETYDCIEISLGMAELDPDAEGYARAAAAYCLPFADKQRFCPGVSVHWNPEGGQFYLYTQVRVGDQPKALLLAETEDRLRATIALAYLDSFTLWQTQAAELLPADTRDAIIDDVHGRMLANLGVG